MTLIEAHTALYRIAIEQPGELDQLDWQGADWSKADNLRRIVARFVVHGWHRGIRTYGDLLHCVSNALIMEARDPLSDAELWHQCCQCCTALGVSPP